MKSGNLNFVEHFSPSQACNGTALPLPLQMSICLHVEYQLSLWDRNEILDFSTYFSDQKRDQIPVFKKDRPMRRELFRAYRQTDRQNEANSRFSQVLRRRKLVNPLKRNDPYRGRTAPLTSKRCILYIYSTNIGTEYFKRGIYSPFFLSLSLFKLQFVS